MNFYRLLSFVIVGCARVYAADFCAVTVSIHTPRGIPLRSQINVVDGSGRTVQTLRAKNGLAEICDLGFGAYSLDISPGSCAHTTLHEVSVYYGHTKHYEVISGPCPDQDLVLSSCMFYFRVRDPAGNKLPSLTISGGGTTAQTDGYGRAVMYTNVGTSKVLQFAAAGFEPQSFEADCKSPIEIDREITMLPKK
jgi:hypothetical protein